MLELEKAEKNCNIINNITISNSNVSIGSCCSDCTVGNGGGEDGVDSIDRYPFDPNNPYSGVGAIHKLLTEKILLHLENHPVDSWEAAFNVCVTVLRNEGFVITDTLALRNKVAEILSDTSRDDYGVMISNLPINTKYIDVLQGLKDMITLNPLDPFIVINKNTKTAAANIIGITTDNVLTNRDAAASLSFCSTLQSSAYLWLREIADDSVYAVAKENVGRVILADTIGSADGYLSRGVVGAIIKGVTVSVCKVVEIS